jgi:hypothetical protein
MLENKRKVVLCIWIFKNKKNISLFFFFFVYKTN